ERAQDVPELVEHFLASRQIGPTRFRISPDALAALCHYQWPGNVRELANVLERAQILAEEFCITPDDLPDALATPIGDTAEEDAGAPQNLHHTQRRHVLGVLKQCHGNKVQTARALGISRRALYRLLDKYQIRGNDHAEPPVSPS